MHERFDFQIVGNVFAHAGDIGKAHFARHDNAAHAQIVIRLRSFGIHARRLGRKMQLELWRYALAYGKRAHVAHDGRIHARILQHGEEVWQRRHVAVFHERIRRHENLHAMLMGEFHGGGDARIIEVRSAAAHAKALARQIYGVGAEMDGAFQLLHAARRRQQLHRSRHAGAGVFQRSNHGHSIAKG